MVDLAHKPPETLRRQGIRGGRDNLGADQAVSLPPGLIMDMFGADLVDRMQKRRRPTRRPRTVQPRNTRQRELPVTEGALLRAAYDYADLGNSAGVSFEQACESPALLRCLRIIAARNAS